ncbi:MAG: hypothetical protein RLZZ292_3403 [Bacteroidota bacterium]
MKQLFFTAAIFTTFLFFACKETPKTNNNAATADQKPADSTQNRSVNAAPAVMPDSLIVMIDSMGKVTLGNREYATDDLTKALIDSSLALKKTFGQLPKTITYKSNGAMMGVRGAVRDAIEDAQEALKKTMK